MKSYISIITILIIFAGGCGSIQTKSDENSDPNDAFFDDVPSVFSGKPKENSEAKSKTPEVTTDTLETAVVEDVERGYASWYGKELHGKPTASGEIFDMNGYTAAHRTYPMGSLILIRNLENGKKKLVRINDRGPYVEGRVVDVSYAVARELGFAEAGVARVEVELIERGEDNFLSKAEEKSLEERPYEDKSDASVEVVNADDYFFPDGIRPHDYTVRMGAFKVMDNAMKYREELEDRFNMNAFLGKKGKWTYIWLGDFEDEETAQKLYQELKTDGLDVMSPRKVQ